MSAAGDVLVAVCNRAIMLAVWPKVRAYRTQQIELIADRGSERRYGRDDRPLRPNYGGVCAFGATKTHIATSLFDWRAICGAYVFMMGGPAKDAKCKSCRRVYARGMRAAHTRSLLAGVR